MRIGTRMALLAATLVAGCSGWHDEVKRGFRAGDYYGESQAISSLAATGDPEAVTDLGYLYQYGIVYPKDEDHALALYKQAAALGYVPAETALGVLYVQGDTVPHDYPQAVMLFESALKQGDPHAGFDLGRLYWEGWGVPQDAEKWKTLKPNSSPEMSSQIAAYAAQMRSSVIARIHHFSEAASDYVQPALVSFAVEHGRAVNIRILRSSGSAAIDSDLSQAVSDAVFPPPPPGMLIPADFKVEANQ